jgi:sulfate adenylyltransferase
MVARAVRSGSPNDPTPSYPPLPFRRLPSSLLSPHSATAAPSAGLQAPHGGKLVELFVDSKEKADIKAKCKHTLECSDRNACDVELLVVGGFSPLTGFMNETEYNAIVKDMRMTSGLIFGLPIVLDTNSEDIKVRGGGDGCT